MEKLIIENIRCFRSRQEVTLAPLTLLVGENSTGKSTFLSCIRIAWDLIQRKTTPNFNEEPFFLGTFNQIVNYNSKGKKTSKEFTIGFEIPIIKNLQKRGDGKKNNKIQVVAIFREAGLHPRIEQLKVEFSPYIFSYRNDVDIDGVLLEIQTPLFSRKIPVSSDMDISTGAPFAVLRHYLDYENEVLQLMSAENSKVGTTMEKINDIKIAKAILINVSSAFLHRPYAFAPIRSKPKRTYDPVLDIPHPEGSHIPMVLAKLYASSPSKWKDLKKYLEEFGSTCGLFDSIDIYPGKRKSDPFQIRVKVSGIEANLIDVGYGVSQALPILIDTLLRPEKLFLMQQPEVHLHPKAQSELGTFLGYLVKNHSKRFVVETHSDYLVERILIDVRDRKILNPDLVAILYFEKQGADVVIHHLRVDKYGNIQDAPPGYRKFFIEEEKRFLGV